ncbi:MAG: gluconokinase [Microbacteriaceae bacterium]|nr:gluconokinase [Microbacteriaceae bacterium]
MGVSGSGKSTVSAALAQELGLPFVDADNLHPATNVAKMAAGRALTDADRMPWLDHVGAALVSSRDSGMVMACSALKRRYREAILTAASATQFVFLDASQELLENRLRQRRGHFMPPALLSSQLIALERLDSDEPGITVIIDEYPQLKGLVTAICGRLAVAPKADS